MPIQPTEMAVDAFYRASLACLHNLEARATRRRFGPDADATWKAFAGSLTTADRIDFILRDAAVTQPGAFAPAQVFDLDALAADEPTGPAWPSLNPVLAEELWRSPPEAQGQQPSEVLAKLAAIWGLTLQPVSLPPIVPASRIGVAGASAIAALADHFAKEPDLAWGEQVTCVAELPAQRHLAGLAVALLNSAATTVLPTQPQQRFTVTVISADATAAERGWLEGAEA